MKVDCIIVLLVFAISVFSVKEASAARKLIVVLIDGVRWDYIDDPKLNGFRRLANSGVKAPYVIPIYPAVSYPNYYSIVTGLYAENHGFVDNYMYDNGSFFFGAPDVKSYDPLWWSVAEPIWITAEKNNMSTAMYWWDGCEVRINGHHPSICERYRFGPPTPEDKEDFLERIDDMVEMFKPSKRFPVDRLSLALIYYGSVDYAGHKYGTKSSEMKEALKDIDSILDKLQSKLAKADLKDEVNIIVVSDHGMMDFSGGRFIDLERFQSDIKYQIQGGTQSMIVPKDGMLDKLYNDLKSANIEGLQVYKKDTIPERYHVKRSSRMTPLYLVTSKGYSIKGLRDTSKNVAGAAIKEPVAKHGYDPYEVEDMRTIFLASGPDFKVGHRSAALNITDIYNVMCHILEINPLPNNGSWDAVKSILKNEDRPHVTTESSRYLKSSAMTDNVSLNCIVIAFLFSGLFINTLFKNI